MGVVAPPPGALAFFWVKFFSFELRCADITFGGGFELPLIVSLSDLPWNTKPPLPLPSAEETEGDDAEVVDEKEEEGEELGRDKDDVVVAGREEVKSEDILVFALWVVGEDEAPDDTVSGDAGSLLPLS